MTLILPALNVDQMTARPPILMAAHALGLRTPDIARVMQVSTAVIHGWTAQGMPRGHQVVLLAIVDRMLEVKQVNATVRPDEAARFQASLAVAHIWRDVAARDLEDFASRPPAATRARGRPPTTPAHESYREGLARAAKIRGANLSPQEVYHRKVPKS